MSLLLQIADPHSGTERPPGGEVFIRRGYEKAHTLAVLADRSKLRSMARTPAPLASAIAISARSSNVRYKGWVTDHLL